MTASKAEPAEAFRIGGTEIPPGRKVRLELPVARLATGTWVSLPVVVVHGRRKGPTLMISAALHGDELNGIEIIRRVLAELRPAGLAGTVVAIPIVNVFGFVFESRYLPDRRDLNRSFPGSARGSLAARLANLFMREVVARSTYGIDLHTATQHRRNLPQIRANMADAETFRIAAAFGAPLMIHSRVRDGSLREAATARGVHMLLYEGGEALRFDDDAIEVGVTGVLRVLGVLGMRHHRMPDVPTPNTIVTRTKWVRAGRAGIFHLDVSLGDLVERRQPVGGITTAFGDRRVTVRAPCDGVVMGVAQNPIVNRGDALVHVTEVTHSLPAWPRR